VGLHQCRSEKKVKERRFAAGTSLLTSPATRRPPPKCGAFRRQPRCSLPRQTPRRAVGDLRKNLWQASIPIPDPQESSHLIESGRNGLGRWVAGPLHRLRGRAAGVKTVHGRAEAVWPHSSTPAPPARR
jgi:hypothetical protein